MEGRGYMNKKNKLTNRPMYHYIILLCIVSVLFSCFLCNIQGTPISDYVKYYRISVMCICLNILASITYAAFIFALIRTVIRENIKYSIVIKNTMFYISIEWLIMLLVSTFLGYSTYYSTFMQVVKRIVDILLLISCFSYTKRTALWRYVVIFVIYFVIVCALGYVAYTIKLI